MVTAFTLLLLALPMLLAQAAQAEDTRLFVDAVATQNGDGSRDNPFWRITDAVERARALRQEDHEKRIVIDVLPGTYTGSYDPAHLPSNPKLELLPIILNVSDLSLEGATAFDEDGHGLLTGTYPPETETLVTTDLPLTRGQMLLLIASTTDGMAGNQVSVSGFVTDAQAQGQPGVPGFLIYADRVSDFSIHHNLARRGNGLGNALCRRIVLGDGDRLFVPLAGNRNQRSCSADPHGFLPLQEGVAEGKVIYPQSTARG